MTEDLDALADLRARVERIEQQLADRRPTDATDPAPADEPGTWWLLEELRRRVPAPAVAFGGTAPDVDGAPVRWQITRGSDELLQTDWSAAAPTLAALGHPSRLQILQLVARGEARTAAELAGADGLSTTGQIYHHLRQLVAGGWLRVTTRGQHEVPAERLVPLLVVLAAAGRA
jgi:DNA-binding transcriptional ArsR family regulator